MNAADLVSVVMSSSPIPSHPSTEIIDQVIDNIRFHLGDVEIFLLCDGVRVPEHEHRRANYEEYKNKMRGQKSIHIMEWSDSVQQAWMFREALQLVKTPLLLQNEHDYTLTRDPIDWQGIIRLIETDQCRVVRFHNGEEIHPLHQYLILDGIFEGATGYHGGTQVKPIPMMDGVPILRTIQFWFCPFLTTTKWMREQINNPEKFSANTYCEIEPAMYTWVENHPWEDYRVGIYAPSKPSMRRSQHLGGRGHDKDDPKRDFKF